MANRKASAFTTKSSLVDSDYVALANASTNYRALLSAFWTYIQGKLKGSAASIADNGTIALEANAYVIALVVTNAGGSNVTVSVGTADNGTDIVSGEVIAAGTTDRLVINYYQASAANIHFTLNTGSLSVRVIKI
jgi:hypothetical protein